MHDTRCKYTDCHFGWEFDMSTTQRLWLDKPYLRYWISSWFKKYWVEYPCTYSIVHDEFGSTIVLASDNNDDGDHGDDTFAVRCKLIVDFTGHETPLILHDIREQYLNLCMFVWCVLVEAWSSW